MTDYRYILEKGSKKYRCPSCNKKRFVKYIDRKEDSYLPEKYGRCDRQDNCGYHKKPCKDDGFNIDSSDDWRDEPQQVEQEQPDFIPFEILKASRRKYEGNKFIQYLVALFDESTVSELIPKYHVGSSKHWPGSTVFWQVDQQGNIRSGKVMLYDDDGHRVKGNNFSYIDWVHTIMYGRGDDNEFNLVQCLFGEHLLSNNKSIPVAIVESEKTAIIASVYFPKYIWLASGAKHNLKPEKCQSLMGRDVTLFPDLGAFEDWQEKAQELSYFCNINTSELLENIADDVAKGEGYDLADYLIQFDVESFQNSHSKPLPQKKADSNGNCETKEFKKNENKPNDLSIPEEEFNKRFNSYQTAPF